MIEEIHVIILYSAETQRSRLFERKGGGCINLEFITLIKRLENES